MSRKLWIQSLFLLIAFTQTFNSLAATQKKEIVIGFNPAENAEVVEINGQAFADYYRAKTGLGVKTFIATDYTALIEALRSGQVDFAFLPPFSYVKAEEVAGAKVLLKSVRKGKAYFYSAIITRADKNYKTIEDLRGKNIAWVDPSSSSGHIFPKASLMAKKKIDPDTYFGKQVFAGSHDALVLAVLNGTVDAGATFSNDVAGKDGAWTQFLTSDADRAKIRVVYVTDPITGDTMATSRKLLQAHPAVIDQTVKVLTEMGASEEGKKILAALYRIDAMVPAKSEDYEPVRQAARALKVMN
jgi:phosphonate transport system substrate-binding protein